MADEQKTPVAIRITRPYATEQDYLEREFDTLTRTSVVLLGAQPRPQGVVLRFEIVLSNGESLIRGEGRVVGFKERAYAGEPGLTLRFTRLDARSKTLLDQAAALREARVKASASVMGMPAVVVPKAVDSGPHPSQSFLEPRALEPLPPPPAAPVQATPSRRAPPPLPPAARSMVPPAPPSSVTEIEIESTQVDSGFHEVASHAAPEPPPRFDEPLAPVPPPLPAPPPSPRAVTAPELPSRPMSSRPPPIPGHAPSAPRVPTRPPPIPPMPPRPASSKPPPIPPSPPRASFPPPAAAPVLAAIPQKAPVPSAAAAPEVRSVGRSAAVAHVRRSSGDGPLPPVSPPPERDELLLRLRTRARSLPLERVNEILAKHPLGG